MTIAVNQCLLGDALEILPGLVRAGVKVQCVVTSPPYWGLRDYEVAGQIGLEPTPNKYINNIVRIFGFVRDLLADDGTLWLNLGDSYSSHNGKRSVDDLGGTLQRTNPASRSAPSRSAPGLADKNLVGIPWRIVFALQDEGWNLRSDIIWNKPNPMPESVKTRPTRAHEYIFLFSKKQKYYYNHEAVQEPVMASTVKRLAQDIKRQKGSNRVPGKNNGPMKAVGNVEAGRNLRDVWTIATTSSSVSHFAAFPEKLAETCIKAGSRTDDVVFDPFMGSGTVAVVSERLGRKWLGIELNPDYLEIQNQRMALVNPLLKAAGL